MVEHMLTHGAHIGDSLPRAVDVGFEETVEKIVEHVAKVPVAILLLFEICHNVASVGRGYVGWEGKK